ncbi:hypothetical protein DASC09_019200 [Saccharomycopsis crataegensis]|uniref:6-O-methylguanine-DNA methyltransferase n=1 Tax=Saccharomycopsis crataegensis TaxID=43959 RepID=A0AAV5QJN9_9ASCO|nr:hypothetical protein DASC09_019200 [Saccharomycopsis crataegensis]
MPNEEAQAFHYAVYDEVKRIPFGKVTTYGHIAKLIFRPMNARQVGQSLKFLPREISQNDLYNIDNVPWWRVINAQGKISPRAEGMQRQEEMLRNEGVDVEDGKVSLVNNGWFPTTEFDIEEEEDDDDEDEDDDGDEDVDEVTR